jgi:hypothetical protein
MYKDLDWSYFKGGAWYGLARVRSPSQECLTGFKLKWLGVTIKIISITPPSVIKMYLYVYMPLHVSVDNNHQQKANQHRKETTITYYKNTSNYVSQNPRTSQNLIVEVIIKVFKILSPVHQVLLTSWWLKSYNSWATRFAFPGLLY